MGGELTIAGLLFVGEAVLLAAIPLVLLAGGTRVVNGIQDARLPWTPYVELAALAIGVMAGLIVLVHNIEPDIVGPGEVFRTGGPWDLSLGAFLATFANPLRYDISAILPVPFSGQLPTLAGFAVFLMSGVVLYGPILAFRSRRAFANGIRNVVIVVCSAYLTVYGFAYFLWLANRLNFWIFLLLMVLIHQPRRSERIVLKLN